MRGLGKCNFMSNDILPEIALWGPNRADGREATTGSSSSSERSSRAPSGDHLLRAIFKCTTKTNTFLHVSWFVEIRKCIGSSSTFGGVARRRLSPAKVIQGCPRIPRFTLKPVVFYVFDSRILKIECEKMCQMTIAAPLRMFGAVICIFHQTPKNGRQDSLPWMFGAAILQTFFRCLVKSANRCPEHPAKVI